MYKYRYIGLLFSLCFLSVTVLAAQKKATVLIFSEYEKEVEPYQTRVTITTDYMRFDDGEGAPDFILFDRNKKIIFSTNSDEQTVMSVSPQTIKVVPPFELKQEVQKLDSMNDAPMIAGLKPRHYVFSTNQQHCYDVIAVDGLLNDVLIATRDFNAIVASHNATTLQHLPADQQDPCELSRNIFYYNRYLQFGFPVQEWDDKGKTRALIDFKENIMVDEKLFALPEGYKQFSVKDFREGQVNFDE